MGSRAPYSNNELDWNIYKEEAAKVSTVDWALAGRWWALGIC